LRVKKPEHPVKTITKLSSVSTIRVPETWENGVDDRTFMKRLPDIIIMVCVIGGATALSTGHPWLGAGLLLIALVVGWKRNWCMDSVEEMVASTEYSAARLRRKDVKDHSDSDGVDADAGGDGDD
jgi:hypothetical protein